jgi:CRP-like cAMP-binding protein
MISPELLRRYPYFAPIRESTLKRIAMVSHERKYHSGEHVFDEGDPASHLYMIVHGEVELQYLLPSGEPRTIDMIPAGELIGWTALVDPHRRSARAVADRETEIVAIDADALRNLCEEDPGLGYRLMAQICKTLSSRLDATRVQLAVT